MTQPLIDIFEYNRWANRTLLEACREAPEAALTTEVPGISGTVQSLWTHTIGGEQTFILRTQGRQHEGELHRCSPWPGFDELARVAEETGRALIELARGLAEDETADLPWQGKVFRFPVHFFLTHAAEHGTEHRTEIKVALNTLGFETPDLDGWSYAATKGYGAEVPPA